MAHQPLFYREAGAGPPLLLVHAFPLSGAMWAPQLAGLSGELRLIAPDLRGFGQSPLGRPPASLDDYADDLVALLDTLGLGRVALAGLSMGGYIALALLRRHPERVGALILADTRAGDDTPEGRAGREASAQLAEREGAMAVGEGMLPRLLAPGAPAALRDELRAIMASSPGAALAAAQRCMAARPDSRALLPAIRVPALVVVGAEDVITPPPEARAMAAAIPGARLAEIAGAGHLASMEAPEAFNAALRGLLLPGAA